jgi:16S rRNA (guanine527-N7)-methyltransferase
LKKAGDLLTEGILELGFTQTHRQIEAFLVYLAELKKWNRSCNLTAVTSDREIIIRHFLDSLLFLKVFPPNLQGTIADIGSGAGFPGLPIKILRPDLKMILVEASFKKAEFLRHIVRTLHITGIEIVQKRIEDATGLKVDIALTRALFSIGDFIEKTKKILNESGALILSKGPKLKQELEEFNGSGVEGISFTDIKLPFENVIRHLILLRRTAK